MKKNYFLHSLPFRLLVGVAFGICIGLLLNIIDESAITTAVLNVVVTSKYILGQLISFSVPLIIIGFIAPSITRLGNNASRMLGVAVSIAYASSLGAALFSALSGYLLIPHLSFSSTASHLKALPDVVFELSIPQIMPVMSALVDFAGGNVVHISSGVSALVLAIMLGLASAWTKASLISSFLEEFQKIILAIVSRVIIPILPYFIGLTFCSLAYEGTITRQLPVFLQVIVIVLIGHFIWIALLYILAGIYSRENPLKVVKHYGPAYLTAIGTMSSAATLPVALQCAHRAKPLRKDLVDFGIPLFANIHLCGSVLTEVFFCMAISKILYGAVPAPGAMVLFCVLLGIFAIGAPGVPGGTVMASLGIITGILKFGDSATALMLTIFALQDSFGTACNVTGDGALTLILTGYARYHNIREQKLQ